MNNHTQLEKQAEQILRIADLRQELTDRISGPFHEAHTPDCPLGLQETFLQSILDFESLDQRPLRAILKDRTGQTFPSLESLPSAREIHCELWRLIRALAEIRIFLDTTDHLSDTKCYQLLEATFLNEDFEDMPEGSTWNTHVPLHDYGTADQPDPNDLYLKYYADDQWLADWLNEFPDARLPQKADLPYHRDHLLPVPPETINPGQ